jgi:cell division protein FtsN
MKKQFGGTVVGLMIGVVLGLAAALAVAVYVTKTPPTFANKGQSHTAESDATESKKNKDWDPNAALYGKNPARPATPVVPSAHVAPELGADGKPAPTKPATTTPAAAATASTTTTPATKPSTPTINPATVAKADGKSDVKSDVKADPKPDVKATPADPLGDLLKSKSVGKSSNPTAEPFMYFVQAGAFRTAEDAEAQRARLSLMGVDAKVSEREQSGRTVFRVRSGPFNKEDDADKMKDKLSNAGMDAALVRVQR